MTATGTVEPPTEPKTSPPAYYAHSIAYPFLEDPIVYFIRENGGLVEFERELERPISRLELRPVLEFRAPGFEEVIAFNFNLEKVWPEKIKKNMTFHPSPEPVAEFVPGERSGDVFRVPVALTPRVTAYLKNCLEPDEYAVIKWDVLAKKGDKWYFVDPGAGIRP